MNKDEIATLAALFGHARESEKRRSPTELAPLLLELLKDSDQIRSKDEIAKTLRDLYDSHSKRHNFKPGMLVRWKAHMKNRRRPAYGEPAIVMNVLDDPIISMEDTTGSAYFREPLDILLGVIDSDGDFLCFHFDASRFEPFD